ncbi:2-phospho-L-lactate transferase CofD family protein [Nocardioides soli]|uniref:LPPG:FO 2-phospho-L-lactate transferase n=1 Tax=Nocardioides soli TaxID=1036020 RepID=A0A7W4VW51_9ACTN|nr:LPPG:FO 2-phospho-L-lactate transferase [Nocardioides soli]
MRITALCGGLGGARFALALAQRGLEDRATLITNVADDWIVDGLLVCPDTDAVLYALGGRLDEERGWGIRGDEFLPSPAGATGWFNLGVQDRAHHVRRTKLLADGADLAGVTAVLAREAGTDARVLPASLSPRGSVIVTDAGISAFQEWLVRDHAAPAVRDVRWPGPRTPSPGVLAAIAEADIVVLTSSSPVASLEPTLELDGVREALAARRGAGRPVALISPVVTTPPELQRDRRRHHARAALLACRGVAHEPIAVAEHFADLLTHVVLDPADADLAPALPSHVVGSVAPIVAQDAPSRAALVQACIATARANGAV